jgi:uncharacterized protein with HEPN domain
MSSRDWKLYAEDVYQAALKIERYTADLSLETFVANELVFDAVIRNLEIIGEAIRHIPPQVQEQYPELPWAKIRAMRNILAHEYFGVDVAIVWETVQNLLPPLQEAFARMLEEQDCN